MPYRTPEYSPEEAVCEALRREMERELESSVLDTLEEIHSEKHIAQVKDKDKLTGCLDDEYEYACPADDRNKIAKILEPLAQTNSEYAWRIRRMVTEKNIDSQKADEIKDAIRAYNLSINELSEGERLSPEHYWTVQDIDYDLELEESRLFWLAMSLEGLQGDRTEEMRGHILNQAKQLDSLCVDRLQVQYWSNDDDWNPGWSRRYLMRYKNEHGRGRRDLYNYLAGIFDEQRAAESDVVESQKTPTDEDIAYLELLIEEADAKIKKEITSWSEKYFILKVIHKMSHFKNNFELLSLKKKILNSYPDDLRIKSALLSRL